MSDYQPLRGSIAWKVIEHLKTLKPGEEIATGPLCDAIGMDRPDQINAFMAPAINAGLVSRRNIPEKGRMNWWRLVRPEQAPKVDMSAAGPVVNPICSGCTSETCWDKGCQKLAPEIPRLQDTVADAAAVASKPVRKPEVAPPAEPEPQPEEEPEFDFAIYRSGAMLLWGVQQLEDGSILLSPEQVADIRRQIAWLPAPGGAA